MKAHSRLVASCAMKVLCALVCLCSAICAQDIAGTVTGVTGNGPGTALGSSYTFTGTTPVGSASSVVVQLKNASAYPVEIVAATVNSTSAATSPTSPNFTISGLAILKTLVAGDATSFDAMTISFTPQSTDAVTGYLQVTYEIQKNGCTLASQDPTTACPSQTVMLASFSGTGAPAQFTLSAGGTVLQPNSPTPMSFGNVSTSASNAISFTLTNNTATDLQAPSITLQTELYNSTAFKLDTSTIPLTIPANSSETFTVTFAPGQTGQSNATLLVGSLNFPLTGTGVVIADIDALQISYVDSTGVRTLPQAASPIDFGQVTAGANASATLKFTVTNPSTSWNAVTLSTLALTGVGFSLTGAPAAPITIAPGQSITFALTFTPTDKGTYTGALAIGTRQFSLTGAAISSPLPDFTITVDQQPLASQQQVHLSVQLGAASPVAAIGQVSMTFAPSVANVQDDPAIQFTATNGRQLQLTVASGSQAATYNGQSSITFQTGTTAGTITFTVTFPDKAPVSKSFTIAPQTVQIATATAVRQNPNLVITVTGFDNTYTCGNLNFVFYDTSGRQITPNGISVNASAAFQTYFFTQSKTGGSFSLQATFPVTGDVNQVGSVTLSLSNSSGSSTSTDTFQ